MKILNNLTIKHLCLNKKRTIVTIIGIILSTALMVGVGLLLSSFISALKEDTIKSYGSHNVVYQGISKEDYAKIKNNINIKEVDYTTNIGFSKLENSNDENRHYIFLQGASKNHLNALELQKGRIPKNNNEILISSVMNSNGKLNLSVGNKITLNLGKRYLNNKEIKTNEEYQEDEVLVQENTKEYTIVGVVSNTDQPSSAGYNVYTIDNLSDNSNNIFITFNKPRKTYELSKNITKSFNITNNQIEYNDRLLYFYGASKYDNINSSMLKFAFIALAILSVGCAIVIYNSFAISTTERKKQFGLLSSIGATKKQIRNTVFFEAIVVGVIGIVLGLASAVLGISIVLKILNHLLGNIWTYKFYLVFNYLYIILPVIFMIIVIFISAFIPAVSASKVTPIEAIRLNDDIKIKSKKVKTSKLTNAVFGIEGEIALKNIKRNKKKYRVTIISLFISIVLFISFSTYLQYMISSVDTVNLIDYDASVTISSNEKEPDKIINEIKNYSEVEKTTTFLSNYVDFKSDSEFSKEYKQYQKDNKSILGAVILIGLDDKNYQEYIKQLKVNDNSVILLNKLNAVSRSNNSRKTKQIKYFANDRVNFNICLEENAKCNYEINNIVTSEIIPFGFKNYTYSDVPVLIMKESKYNELVSNLKEANTDIKEILIKSQNYKELSKKLSNLRENNDNVYYSIPANELEQTRNLVLAIRILLYGFITLVTLIGVTSVFNTINTSIMLRKKEFAMLRSVGLTPRGFNKILFFESLFFGFKSLLYALPVSLGIVLLIDKTATNVMDFGYIIWPVKSIIISIIGVFIIVLLTMLYSASKIKKDNILETIREENI